MPVLKKILRVDKKNKNNECPIEFKFNKNKKATFISSNIYIPIDSWDNRKNKIKSSYPFSKQLNAQLNLKEIELNKKFLSLQNEKPRANRIEILNTLINKKITFLDYAYKVVEGYRGEINTHIKTKAIVNKFRSFLISNNHIGLLLNDVNKKIINEFEYYIREKYNNSDNTVSTNLNFIKLIIKKAINDNLFEYEDNPFYFIKIKKEKSSKNYLTENELNQLIEYPLNVNRFNEKYEKARDIFIFACECGGVRISDLLTLKIKNYDGEHLNIMMIKTNRQLRLKVPIKAKAILNKYIGEQSNPEHFIFPFLDNDINIKDNYTIKRGIKTQTEIINRKLKKIAKWANINKNFSINNSRHTFATRALLKGISIEVIQKILGHTEIDNTMIYTKIINTEIDNAMDLI
jgi:integrase